MANSLEKGTRVIALTNKYRGIKEGDMGKASEHFVIFKGSAVLIRDVLAHLENWQIKTPTSFVGNGGNVTNEIPF